jgi:hypothetical protein
MQGSSSASGLHSKQRVSKISSNLSLATPIAAQKQPPAYLVDRATASTNSKLRGAKQTLQRHSRSPSLGEMVNAVDDRIKELNKEVGSEVIHQFHPTLIKKDLYIKEIKKPELN